MSKKEKNESDDEIIYDLLKKDHEEVKSLFNKILDKRRPSEETFSQIADALEVHMTGEEEYFYPELKGENEELTTMTNEAIVEHTSAKTLMNEIEDTEEADEMWLPKVKVLSEMIDHHVEEEEGELFKEAKKVLDKKEAVKIGRKFKQTKSKTMK